MKDPTLVHRSRARLFQQHTPPAGQPAEGGISGSAPFVIMDGNTTSGISLDIWRRVAEDNNFGYEVVS